ncbi:MAG: DUF4249 family protein [Bacteroidota bacterium]
MKQAHSLSFVLALLFLLFSSCIKELALPVGSTAIPYVSGVISHSEGERTITVGEINGINEVVPLSAEVWLLEEDSLAAKFEEIAMGSYTLPMNVALQEGNRYGVEVLLENGRRYQSESRELLPKGEIAEITWDSGLEVIGRDLEGNPVEDQVVNIYASVALEPGEETRYYRWQTANTWSVVEIPKPEVDTFRVITFTALIGGGFEYDTTISWIPDEVVVCYPTTEVSDHPSTLVSTEGLTQGLASKQILQRPLNQDFVNKLFVHAYLHRIDAKTYQFYEQGQRLIDNQGNLFDETPAPLRGNVRSLDDSTELVLGLVEFSQADTMYQGLTLSDLGVFVEDGCRPGADGPIVCVEGFGSPPPCKCYDCPLIYGEETVEIPPYWN